MSTVLITGASAGIGASYARKLAKSGYDLLLVARSASRLNDLADQLSAEYGVRVDAMPADLSQMSQLALVEERLRNDSDIEKLVNNAGLANGGTFAETPVHNIDSILALNVTALTRLAAAASRSFLERGGGTIINVSSVTALAPEHFEPLYAATKAFVLALSQGMHKELSDRGIRVQAVLPGATRTEIWERSGRSVSDLPPEILMEVDDMVDAALAGLALGELVTIPSLPALDKWIELDSARTSLYPFLSLRDPAPRYRA